MNRAKIKRGMHLKCVYTRYQYGLKQDEIYTAADDEYVRTVKTSKRTIYYALVKLLEIKGSYRPTRFVIV